MPTPAITHISPRTLREWMTQHRDLVVVDVRSAAEFESLHIKDSYNVPLNLLSQHTEDLVSRLGERVVLVCQSGVRAEQARQRLAASGLENAYVLDGGASGFAETGGDVVRGASRWDLERQVRMVAGSLVLTGLVGGKFISPRIRAVAGIIGTGLTVSAATNTCAMGKALSVMPWNKAAVEPTAASAIQQIPARSE